MTEQPDNMIIASTEYDCGRCGTFCLDHVWIISDGGQDKYEWLACPHCGWDDRPDEYEPGGFYESRYLN